MAKIALKYDRIRLNPNFISQRDIQRIAVEEVSNTIANNIDKAGRGRDADGNPLKPYSASYREAIKRAVRPISRGKNKGKRTGAKISRGARKGKTRPLAKKAGSTIPNLRVTGELHESRIARRIPNGAEGVFQGTHSGGISNAELAQVQAGYGRDNWHAIGKADAERIDKRFEQEVGAAAEKNLIKVDKGS